MPTTIVCSPTAVDDHAQKAGKADGGEVEGQFRLNHGISEKGLSDEKRLRNE